MVRLTEGKMSSRTGNVVTVEWIIEEIRKRVNKLIKKSDKISKVNIDKVIEKISFGAIKYSLLKTNIGHDVIFDFIESLSLEGNSGPYLQYTYVRTQSVLKKSNSKAYNFDHDRDQSCKINQEEDCLIRTLCLFPEIILNAAQNFAPNFIANYLFDLAQKYNLFYQKYPILKAEKQTRVLRLLITKATGQIIKKGLYLLGIETVDRM